jgi:hypothetical protein
MKSLPKACVNLWHEFSQGKNIPELSHSLPDRVRKKDLDKTKLAKKRSRGKVFLRFLKKMFATVCTQAVKLEFESTIIVYLFTTVQSTEPRMNACSYSPPRGLFLTCEEKMYFLAHYMVYKMLSHVWCLQIYIIKNNPLTWNGGSLYLVTNLCPCRPFAQSQLRNFQSPYPVPIAPFFPSFPHTHVKTTTTDDINMPESSSVGHNTVV